MAYVSANASYLNRTDGHFTALRYFALNGVDHRAHEEPNSMIRRYIAWRNQHTDDEALRFSSPGKLRKSRGQSLAEYH